MFYCYLNFKNHERITFAIVWPLRTKSARVMWMNLLPQFSLIGQFQATNLSRNLESFGSTEYLKEFC